MKNLIAPIFLSLFFTSSAFACFNVSGHYTCSTPEVEGGDPHVVNVEQTDDLYTTTTIFSEEHQTVDSFKIDGKSHIGAFGISTTMICNDNQPLTMKLKGPLSFPSATITFVPTETGFVTYRQSRSGPKEIFQVCNFLK
jgi:hypothetical protein